MVVAAYGSARNVTELRENECVVFLPVPTYLFNAFALPCMTREARRRGPYVSLSSIISRRCCEYSRGHCTASGAATARSVADELYGRCRDTAPAQGPRGLLQKAIVHDLPSCLVATRYGPDFNTQFVSLLPFD